jgi:CHAT domain-containing protein
VLVGRHLRQAFRKPPRAEPHLETAAAYARATPEARGGPALQKHLALWRSFGPEELRAQSEAWNARWDLRVARERQDRDGLLALLRLSESLRRRVLPSVNLFELLCDVAAALRSLDRRTDALARAEEALALARRLDWPFGRARAAFEQGVTHVDLGDPVRGREALEQALALTRSTGGRTLEAHCLTWLAILDLEQGPLTRARENLRRAIAILEEAGRPDETAVARLQLGDCSIRIGDFGTAFEELERARALFEKAGDRRRLGNCLRMLGNVHLGLDDEERALPLLEAALAQARATGIEAEVDLALHNLSVPLERLGRYPQALDVLAECRKRTTTSGRKVQLAIVLGDEGRVLRLLGRLDEAEQRIGSALELDRSLRLHRRVAHDLGELGVVAEARGNLPRARELLEECHRAYRSVGGRDDAALALEHLARVQLAEGRRAEALASADAAVALNLETVRLLGSSGRGIAAQSQRVASLGLEAVLRLLGTKDAGEPRALLETAFRLLESSRALLLLEALGPHRRALLEHEVPTELRTAYQTAEKRVESAQQTLGSLGERAGAEAADLARSRAGRDAAYQELEDVVGRLERSSRRLTALTHPRPIALRELEEGLRRDTAVLLYHWDEARALVLVARPGEVRLVELGSARELREAVEDYLDVVTTPELDERGKAGRLYRLLLAPLEPSLREATRLLISPDGSLSFLPFEALVAGDGTRLADRCEIAYVPSATVYEALRRDPAAARGGLGIVALGDPAGPSPLGPLPRSAAEARTVAAMFPEDRRRLLLGPQATLAGLRAALDPSSGRRAAVHLACHATLDSERPWLSGLVLAGGEPLRLAELHRWRIDADLAVLSACSSGRGKFWKGDGVFGLVRGLFHAGCPRAVVSNWRVSDEGAERLMVAFYDRWARRGMPFGKALQEARLEVIRSGGAAAHPRHWAAFVLWGLPD